MKKLKHQVVDQVAAGGEWKSPHPNFSPFRCTPGAIFPMGDRTRHDFDAQHSLSLLFYNIFSLQGVMNV